MFVPLKQAAEASGTDVTVDKSGARTSLLPGRCALGSGNAHGDSSR